MLRSSVPCSIAPLRWAPLPLQPGSVAIVCVEAGGAAAAEVYGELRAAAAGLGGELAGRSSVELGTDGRYRRFERAYARLVAALLRPSRSREMLELISSEGPEAANRALEARLGGLLGWMQQRMEDGDADEGITMGEYRRELEQREASPAAGDLAAPRTRYQRWPVRANRPEPTSLSLEPEMRRVLGVLDEQRTSLWAIGMSVHLCVHMHRDGKARSSSAARVYQRWWISIADHFDQRGDPAAADEIPAPRVVPNAWLGNWRSQGLRSDEPLFSGPSAAALQSASSMVRRGSAIVYDRLGSVLAFPAGVAAKQVPLIATYPTDRTVEYRCSFATDEACAEAFRDVDPPAQTEILRRDRRGSARDPGIEAQYRQLMRAMTLAVEYGAGGSTGHASGARVTRVRLVRGGSIDVPRVAFPVFLSDGEGAKLSVHLCASDTLHEGMLDEIDEPLPTKDRQTLCWLTIVDLEARSPLGRYNLPGGARYVPYVVPGEIQLYDKAWKPAKPEPPLPAAGAAAAPAATVSSGSAFGGGEARRQVTFKVPAAHRTDRPPGAAPLGLCAMAGKCAFKSIRRLGKQRSFAADGFEEEANTREGPGRRVEKANRTRVLRKGGVGAGGVAGSVDAKAPMQLPPPGALPPPLAGRAEDGAQRRPRVTVCDLKQPPARRRSPLRGRWRSATGGSPPRLPLPSAGALALAAKSAAFRSVRRLGKQRSCLHDGFGAEAAALRDGPGRRTERGSPAAASSLIGGPAAAEARVVVRM